MHPHMFSGYEFLHLLTPTGLNTFTVIAGAGPVDTGHCQSFPSRFGCNVFETNAMHFWPKCGRLAGPRYETKWNEYSAPKFNVYYPGASMTYLEIYEQSELEGIDFFPISGSFCM